MPRYSPALGAALANAPTKTAWAQVLVNQLGANRKFVAKVATIGANVWSVGTVFRDMDLTGDIQVEGGNIFSYGIARNARTQNAADLSTMDAVIRISNTDGSVWAEFTYGLSVDQTREIKAPSNPVAGRGIGFVDFVHLAPQFYPSGNGPAAPAWDDANQPYTVVFDNWENPAAVVESGRASFNDRQDNFTWNAPFTAERGDTGVYLSAQTITHGRHVFGVRLYAAPPIAGSDPSVPPLYQINICCAPAPSQGWTGYPAMANYNHATMSTLPIPFKVRLLNKAGQQIPGGVIEMVEPAGLPINSPLLIQTAEYTANPQDFDDGPVHPHFNCWMQLVWENRMAQDSPAGRSILNGVQADAYRPSASRSQASTNDFNFYFMRSRGPNGIGHPAATQDWPMSRAEHVRPNPDPYINWMHNGSWPYMMYAYGNRFQTGAIAGQIWYMGPGGSRWPRAAIAGQIATFVSDPNGVRAENLAPNRRIYWDFSKAYFNCSISRMRDVRTFESVPVDEVLAGDWQFAGAYYSNGQVSDPNKFIDLRIAGNQAAPDANHFDSTGRFLYGGYAPDYMHYWENPLPAIVSASPMHVGLDKHQMLTMVMSSLGDAKPDRNWEPNWMYRTHAVMLMKTCMSWFMGGKLSIERSKIEARMLIEMQAAYTQVVLPVVNNTSSSIFHQGLRRFGMPGGYRYDDNTKITSSSGNHEFFMGAVLYFCKVTGFWDRMRELSPVVGVGYFDMIVANLWKATIEMWQHTKGWWFGSHHEWDWISFNPATATPQPPSSTMYAGWAAWAAGNPKPHPNAAFNRNADGLLPGPGINPLETAMAPQTHMMRQCMHVLRDHFPTYGNLTVANAAVAEIDACYAEVYANADSKPTLLEKRDHDFAYMFPGSGVLLTPAVI